jgi:hypothetical protein
VAGAVNPRRYGETDRYYLLGAKSALFDNGVACTLEEFKTWEQEGTLVEQVKALEATPNRLYDYKYALNTGQLRRKRGYGNIEAAKPEPVPAVQPEPIPEPVDQTVPEPEPVAQPEPIPEPVGQPILEPVEQATPLSRRIWKPLIPSLYGLPPKPITGGAVPGQGTIPYRSR